MRSLWLIPILAVQYARAQTPTTLAESLKWVQDTLNQQGPVKWVQTAKSAAADPVSVTYEVSGAAVDVNGCTLSFEADNSYPNYKLKMAFKLPLRDVEKISVESLVAAAERFRAESKLPKWDSSTDPTVYNMQIYAVADKKFEVHRRSVNGEKEVNERDQSMSPAVIIFRDEDTAKRVSSSILHARDLCSAH